MTLASASLTLSGTRNAPGFDGLAGRAGLCYPRLLTGQDGPPGRMVQTSDCEPIKTVWYSSQSSNSGLEDCNSVLKDKNIYGMYKTFHFICLV